ncbi:MAG: protein kinase, partial [Myxococcales bacterium]|nr:protein kinase [Myxococcales bacterium]
EGRGEGLRGGVLDERPPDGGFADRHLRIHLAPCDRRGLLVDERLPALLPPLEPDQVDAFRAEVAEQNRRRLMVLAPLMLVVHAVHLWLFSTSAEQRATLAPSVVHWRDAVWSVHAVTEVAVVGFVAFLWLAGRTRAGRWAGAMAAVLWLLHAAATAGADQLNVPTVAPYMAYAVVVGVFVLLTPLEAVTVLGVGLAALTAALFEMQPSHTVRTEQLLNGPSVTLPALLLSGFLYAARRRDFVQRATIDRQQQALATLNAELEQRVRDQVAEITQRAAEVEVLNVRLRAQVRAQADQLAAALASSDPTGGHAMDRLVEGRVLSGRFEVGGRLGAGGMGEVHAGIDRETGERVAIKVVNPAAWPQPEDLQRFLREVRTAASVSHPAVVRMLHVDVSDTGLLFQVQELVEGTSLETCTAAERAFEPGPVARVGAALCEARGARAGRDPSGREAGERDADAVAAGPQAAGLRHLQAPPGHRRRDAGHADRQGPRHPGVHGTRGPGRRAGAVRER